MNLNLQKELHDEVQRYNEEYSYAIDILMENNNINKILSPISTLIIQYIENIFKAILQDFYEIEKTAKQLNIDNHDLKGLLSKIKDKYKKYTKLQYMNNCFDNLDMILAYYMSIFDDNLLINARYPLNSKKLIKSKLKDEVDEEEYKVYYYKLKYEINKLINFYQVEKIYQKILPLKNSKEKLVEFMNYIETIQKFPLYVSVIKDIDQLNKNILEDN